MDYQKKVVKAYFRYHHFHTLPTKESHQHFMSCLRNLEVEAEEDFDIYDYQDTWKAILKAINSLNQQQIDKLHTQIKFR